MTTTTTTNSPCTWHFIKCSGQWWFDFTAGNRRNFQKVAPNDMIGSFRCDPWTMAARPRWENARFFDASDSFWNTGLRDSKPFRYCLLCHSDIMVSFDLCPLLSRNHGVLWPCHSELKNELSTHLTATLRRKLTRFLCGNRWQTKSFEILKYLNNHQKVKFIDIKREWKYID